MSAAIARCEVTRPVVDARTRVVVARHRIRAPRNAPVVANPIPVQVVLARTSARPNRIQHVAVAIAKSFRNVAAPAAQHRSRTIAHPAAIVRPDTVVHASSQIPSKSSSAVQEPRTHSRRPRRSRHSRTSSLPAPCTRSHRSRPDRCRPRIRRPGPRRNPVVANPSPSRPLRTCRHTHRAHPPHSRRNRTRLLGCPHTRSRRPHLDRHTPHTHPATRTCSQATHEPSRRSCASGSVHPTLGITSSQPSPFQRKNCPGLVPAGIALAKIKASIASR